MIASTTSAATVRVVPGSLSRGSPAPPRPGRRCPCRWRQDRGGRSTDWPPTLGEIRDLIDKNRERSEQSLGEIRDLIDRNHRELSGSLGDARERLSRMEGYLRASPAPPPETDDGDAEAA